METEVLFRDSKGIQPDVDAIKETAEEPENNVYGTLEQHQFIACQEDIWQPVGGAEDEDGEMGIKVRATAGALHPPACASCARDAALVR